MQSYPSGGALSVLEGKIIAEAADTIVVTVTLLVAVMLL